MIVPLTAERVDAPAPLGFDKHEASEFLDLLYPGGGVPSLWRQRDRLSHHATSRDECLRVAGQWSADGCDVYFGVGIRRPGLPPEKRGAAGDVVSLPALFIDVDMAGGQHASADDLPANEDEAYKIVDAVGLEPTMVVHSSGGLHVYYAFDRPLEVDAGVRDLLKRFGSYAQSKASELGYRLDPVFEVARVLRLPGTLNHKTNPPKRVTLDRISGRCYGRESIEALLPASVVRERPMLRIAQDVSPNRAEIYGATALKNECEAVASSSNGERNNQLNRSAFSLGQLVGGGVLDRGVVESSLTSAAESAGLPSFEIARTIRSGIEDGEKNPRSIPDEPMPIRRHRQGGPEAASADAPDVLDSTAPMDTARAFLKAKRTHASGLPTLRRHLGSWWSYDGHRYVEVGDEEVQAEFYGYLDGVKVRVVKKDEERLVPFAPNRTKVGDTAAATKAQTIVSGEMPQWLDGRTSPAPRDVVAFQNGLLDVEAFCRGDVSLMPPTPAWFSGAACPYAFDPEATCENWLNFLGDVFDADVQSMDLLQEWFGLQLVPDVSYEKLMLMVGPPRAGKGTALSAMEAMLGRDQIAVTSFSRLAEGFGLAPLLGKLSAIMPDAHLGKSTDDRRALETLKSITGGDPQAVNRKNVDELPSVRLMTRFSIAVNELPKLPDDAGSLQPRLLVLHFGRSFAGREDTGLKARLMAEAPGVALWALEGLKRLRERGVFTTSDRSAEIVNEFRRLVAPVQGFVEDRCIVSPDAWASKDDVYRAYCEWCEGEGNQPESKVVFGRHLIGAAPSVTSGRRGPRNGQFTSYEGLKLL